MSIGPVAPGRVKQQRLVAVGCLLHRQLPDSLHQISNLSLTFISRLVVIEQVNSDIHSISPEMNAGTTELCSTVPACQQTYSFAELRWTSLFIPSCISTSTFQSPLRAIASNILAY